jgi:hypothetical protein
VKATAQLPASASQDNTTAQDIFGRGAQLECEQIYAKVLGANHEETLDAAMCAQTVGEEEEDEEGEEGDSDEGEEEGQAGDSGERE